MTGIDYSGSSIALAGRLVASRGKGLQDIRFEVCDILAAPAVPSPSQSGQWAWMLEEGFDLVMDKGTFDAMSLSEETYVDEENGGVERRVCERYPGIVASLVRKGGWVMVTSCNWTEEEVVRWFGDGTGGELRVWGRVEYPRFRFGGMEGQGVCSVCFRRKE